LNAGTENIDTGMHLRDLLTDVKFARRRTRRRDPRGEAKALRQLACAIAVGKDSVLQELVEVAVRYCGADSAGISLLETAPNGEQKFRWIAIAGSFAKYLHGTTPRNYSPCGTTLDRNAPQLYSVTRPYYDFLGVEAADISDGMLIPWTHGKTEGTLWAVSHSSRAAFCPADYQLLHSLAEFASIAISHLQSQVRRRLHEKRAASAAMANALAHQINNPLQSLTNTLYLAQKGGGEASSYIQQATVELEQVTDLVRRILSLDKASTGVSSVSQSLPAPTPAILEISSASVARRRRKYPAPAAVA